MTTTAPTPTAATPTVPTPTGFGPTAGGRGTADQGTADQGTADLAGRLRIAAGRLAREATAHADGITPSRLAAMSVLDRCGPLRVGALAEKVGISAPTVSRLVDCLAERGLVVRTADPDDHRAIRISLSPAGSATLHSVRELGASVLAERIGGLAEAERAALVAAIPVLESLS